MFRIAAATFFLWAGNALADNLLQDPGFADGISPPWVEWIVPAAVDWDPFDANGSAESGSLLFRDAGEFGAVVYQCVDMTGNSAAGAAYSYFVPDDVVDVSFAPALFLSYYPEAECEGSFLGSSSVQADWPAIQGQWIRISGPVEIPVGTLSVRFQITMVGSGGTDNRAHVDDVVFGDPPIFKDRFETVLVL